MIRYGRQATIIPNQPMIRPQVAIRLAHGRAILAVILIVIVVIRVARGERI